MNVQSLVAEYSSLDDARVGLKVLEKFDFESDAVSLVSREEPAKLPELRALQRPDETAANAATLYEERLEEGSVLIIVTSTPMRLDEAEDGLQTTNPVSMERFSLS